MRSLLRNHTFSSNKNRNTEKTANNNQSFVINQILWNKWHPLNLKPNEIFIFLYVFFIILILTAKYVTTINFFNYSLITEPLCNVDAMFYIFIFCVKSSQTHRFYFHLISLQDLNNTQHRFEAEEYVRKAINRRHVLNDRSLNHFSDSEWNHFISGIYSIAYEILPVAAVYVENKANIF